MATGSSVLLVEDNDVNRLVARRLLEKLGMKVSEATDGTEALKMIDNNRFDLVLMDCRMPTMDGYQATGLIRERQRTGDLGPLPVVAMTANAMAGDREKCLEAGMDDYLTKPVNQGTLSEMLSKWLKPMENSAPAEAVAATTPSEGKTKMGIGSEIDLNIINELKSIMEDDFVSLLESYINNVTPLYKELHAAAVADNVAGMVNPAHSIKSSSANIGAMKVSAAAKTIEMAARNNDGATAKKAFQTINQVLPPAVKELNAIIAANR
jgi:CheY-like chemotaxis protein